MAAMPPVAAAASTFTVSTAVSFAAQIGMSYMIGRFTAQDGPRLKNLQASGGDYGIAMPRAYGDAVRLTGIFIAQAKIKETKHTVSDHSTLIGAATGAAQGFLIGGPVGAVVGGIVGGLFGAAAPNQHYYTYSDTFALMFADRKDDDPIEGITKLWANGKVIFNSASSVLLSEVLDGTQLVSRKYGKQKYCKSLTIYGGGLVQTADPILDDKIGLQPGYRGIAYIVIEDLQLAIFGNSVPPVEGLVVAKSGQTLADTVESICAAANVDPVHNMSSTALVGFSMGGYGITSETNCWDAIRPLLPVYRVDVSEVGGQLQFYKRSRGLRATIPLDDMAGHVFGDDRPDRIKYSRATDIDLPQETSFTFVDPARDYQANTASSKRSEGDAKSNISISIPLTLTADEGATAAATIHWDAWLGRTGAMFGLTDQWIGISPGVAYGIEVATRILPFRLTRKTRGANGIIECEVVSDESVAFIGVVAGSSGNIPDEESTDFPDTRVVAMDMAIYSDFHDEYGFYVAMGGETGWSRGRIDASGDGGVNWGVLVDMPGSAIIGDVTGTLAAGTTDGLDDTLDTVTVLTVVLIDDAMELESVTDALLDAWDNFAFVGKDGLGEYLQFKTATKVDTATWELTDLRRGRKGTDFAIGTHASGEEFVLLGGDGVFRIPYADTSFWGNLLNLRGVTLHQDDADADVIDFTNTGEGKRPYSPVNVAGTWDGSNNLTITWDARSRLNVGGLGIDDQDNFEVEITSGAGRTITATGVSSAAYPAADQTTDTITPGDTIDGRVRQLSDVNDGRWRNFTLVGPNDLLFDSTDTTFDDTSVTWDAG
jgi:hypothetical protein